MSALAAQESDETGITANYFGKLQLVTEKTDTLNFTTRQNHPPRLQYLEERAACLEDYKAAVKEMNAQGRNGDAAAFLAALALPFTNIKCAEKNGSFCKADGKKWHLTCDIHNLNPKDHPTSIVELWEIPAEALSDNPTPEDLALSARVVRVEVPSTFGGFDIGTDPDKVWLVPARISVTATNGEKILHDYVAPSAKRLKTEKRPKNGVIRLQMPRPALH